ncbi:Hypothetical Protein FCC1311_048272 [Hondaea fermentalgiana]|uniref:Uncharacterized protein n=1 Tax=Hondaea fermentalgiana TaxID=2315210 RepID=A0A2R5GC89_9STRA|nr:Hypothetical Protein FCC1311_048272 [Hondaea fermentalgiana]|eukprot:GBG28606.1 Hypothetical Protein FCC1311_048272 [Hondaea fermentalgiana]
MDICHNAAADLEMVDDESEDEEPGSEDLPMSFEQLTEVKYRDSCFACKYINSSSLRENPEFVALMKLYTENAGSVSRPALFQLVKDHFDAYCRPVVQAEWSIACIEEHFTLHTNFPTDEVLKQLKVLVSIRNKMISTLLTRNVRTGEVKAHSNNIKNLITIQKEIRELLSFKKKLPTLLGYSEVLDF